MVGGKVRKRVIVLLAGVLALSAADLGAIGAVAEPIKGDLALSNADVGLLASAVAIAGGLATLPVGMLTDRINRTRLLGGSITLWAVAMVAGGLAPDFGVLVWTRVFLGLVVATAGPAIASLVGDLFFPHERGRVLGFILAGELLGTGIGYVAAGAVTAILPWRAVFFLFAIPALLLARGVWRLREPKRGGQDRLEPVEPAGGRRAREEADDRSVQERVREAGITPTPGTLLGEDPARLPLHRAVRYLLSMPSNLALILASALGYFFFAGLRTFGVLFIAGHFNLGSAVVSTMVPLVGVGALLGVLVGGRLGDRLVRRGWYSGRMVIGAVGYLTVAALLPFVLATSSLALALPLLIVIAAGLAWPNPAIDSARLDVVVHRLWGRAEGVRTVLRTAAEATAPLLFGVLSDHIAGGGTAGLRWTFGIMLLPLVASAVVLLRARRHYAGDVAAAAITEDRFRETGEVAPATSPAG